MCVFFYATQPVVERMLFFLGLHADLWSKFKLVSQEVGVLWGPPGGHILVGFLISRLLEPNDVVGMLCFCPSLKALNHLWQFELLISRRPPPTPTTNMTSPNPEGK